MTSALSGALLIGVAFWMINSEISAKRLLDALVYGVLENATTAVIDGSYYEQISELVEADTFDAQSPLQLAELAFCSTSSRLLDFGCGTGTYRDVLSNMGYSWSGVNYRQGMALEAAYQASSDPAINFYDGVVLPFESEYFDVILPLQTFEHIQHIDATFGEIRHVLVRGGKLVGSVSYLEQIHDYSTFNFTPLGFRMAMERNGLVVKKLFPRMTCSPFSCTDCAWCQARPTRRH